MEKLYFLEIDTLDQVDINEIYQILFSVLEDENMVIDNKSRKVANAKADLILTTIKNTMESLYAEANKLFLLSKESFDERNTAQQIEIFKMNIRNLEYILSMLSTEIKYEQATNELSSNYYSARVELKLKSTKDSFSSKNAVLLEAANEDKFCIAQYKDYFFKRVLQYFDIMIKYCNQTYYLINKKLNVEV